MLEKEIEDAQRLVKTDSYSMSLGEIVNMYNDKELFINPDFQRLFRWESGQKSKLIESILLGIPIPSIFVFEQEDGTWELIDGLQRVSTILEFLGSLIDPDTNDFRKPLYLRGTDYLPSLENVVWKKSTLIEEITEDNQVVLGQPLKLALRRSRINVEILKRPSDNNTKYDLFQRLNAGGTPANPQELRNCMIIMVNPQYFQNLKELAENQDFVSVLSASSDQQIKQRHVEYASRFMVQTFVDYDNRSDVEDFITQGILSLAANDMLPDVQEKFRETFRILNNLYAENALRRMVNGNHQGRFTIAGFECIAIGIARNYDAISTLLAPEDFIRERIERFWESDQLDQFFTPGLRGTVRIQRTIPFGEQFFKP